MRTKAPTLGLESKTTAVFKPLILLRLRPNFFLAFKIPVASFLFALNITLPIFFVLALGSLLMRTGALNEAFLTTASKLSFNIALPALLFISITQAEIDFSKNLSLVAYGLAATSVFYVLLEIFIPRVVPVETDRGVVIQGSFRSNMGIIGFAYCVNAYGESASALAAIYLAIVTVLYNVLAVTTLTRWLGGAASRGEMIKKVLTGIMKNPLILAICAALVIKTAGLSLPGALMQTGNYLAQMALPLALLCAGASLKFRRDSTLKFTVLTTVLRLLIISTCMTVGAYLFGFRGTELGILFMMSSAPSAAASYTMVRAMNGNSVLAANIIALTTGFSLLTTGIGAALLHAIGVG